MATNTVALSTFEVPDRPIIDSLRTSLWAAWGPDNAFAQAGQPLSLYILGVLNALLSVLLPVLLLGAFVFKLFQHDPLEWRLKLTLEAHPSGQFVLAARFYNHFTVDVADLRVRAWLRWVPLDNRSVRRNKRLKMLTHGQHGGEAAFPLAVPAEPTTARMILGSTLGEKPIDESGEKILIQGEYVHRSEASIVLVVDGITTTMSEPFRSTKSYRLDTDLDIEMFQDIPLDSLRGKEWENFNGTQQIYMFVYGSLMRFDDLENAGVPTEELRKVTLKNWSRAWNVASDPSQKGREYYKLDENGKRREKFEGHIVSLGLKSEEGSSTMGIVARVGYETLAKFDLREMDYDRVDVTRDISWVSPGPGTPYRVFTYIPKKNVVDKFEELKKLNQAAIVESYYESVKRAATDRGSEFLKNFEEAGLIGLNVYPMERVNGPDPRRL